MLIQTLKLFAMDSTAVDPKEEIPQEEPKAICTNCGKKMAKKGKFCPHCGQKRFEGRIPLKELTGKFLYKLTNLDSKFLRMAWRLLIPARVTLDYFGGKIKQYPHPFQFFFIIMFFFLLIYNKVSDDGTGGVRFNLNAGDSDIDLNAKTPKNARGKKQDFYFLLERYVFSHQILAAYDSLPNRLQTPEVKESLKIVLNKTNGQWTNQLDTLLKNEKSRDSLSLYFGIRKMRIAYQDIIEYTPEELTEHYGVKDFLGKTLLRQGVRSIQNPKALVAAYIGSFSWTILALVIFMAGFMHLFYLRQKRYYVEHFVLLLHFHSGVLLMLMFVMIWNYYFPLGGYWAYIALGIAVFLWFSMKRFYGQNWFWTTLKCFGFSFFYLLGFAVFFVVGLLVVFTFF